MPNNREHLDLPSNDKVFKRKIRAGGGYIAQENINDFAKKQIKKLDDIGKEFTGKDGQFPGYKQELVFKVKTSQKVNEMEVQGQVDRA